jgi:hypothetical protein
VTLSHLLPLFKHLSAPDPHDLPNHWWTEHLPSAARPAVIAALAVRTERPVLVIVGRQEAADLMGTGLLQFLPPGSPPVPWSAADPLPYEQLPHDAALSARRSATLG